MSFRRRCFQSSAWPRPPPSSPTLIHRRIWQRDAISGSYLRIASIAETLANGSYRRFRRLRCRGVTGGSPPCPTSCPDRRRRPKADPGRHSVSVAMYGWRSFVFSLAMNWPARRMPAARGKKDGFDAYQSRGCSMPPIVGSSNHPGRRR